MSYAGPIFRGSFLEFSVTFPTFRPFCILISAVISVSVKNDWPLYVEKIASIKNQNNWQFFLFVEDFCTSPLGGVIYKTETLRSKSCGVVLVSPLFIRKKLKIVHTLIIWLKIRQLLFTLIQLLLPHYCVFISVRERKIKNDLNCEPACEGTFGNARSFEKRCSQEKKIVRSVIFVGFFFFVRKVVEVPLSIFLFYKNVLKKGFLTHGT